MAPSSSRASSISFVKIAGAAALVVVASVALRDRPARACGGFDVPFPEDFMTFDPAITDDPDGIAFHPMLHGFGDCGDCAAKAMLDDWHGYWKGAISDDDWKKVLLPENPNDDVAPRAKLAKKGDRARDALAYVDLAHRVEPFAAVVDTRPPGALVLEAQAAFRAARDRFLQQRYGFQVMRLLFYGRDWAGAIAFFDKNFTSLQGPSPDLAWRTRYYVAGAARRSGRIARGNLELARVHASYAPLAASAAIDFNPSEDGDWREALKLAQNAHEKAELWRLVGVKTDGLVAAQEIFKLEPKSSMLALLVVRELSRAEQLGVPVWGAAPAAKDIAARKKALATLEALSTKLLAGGADRPWIYELVLGHIAAKRGDLPNARTHLEKALALRPSDVRVANQARASLALALVANWRIDPTHEDELARTMNAVGNEFGRITQVQTEVRHQLAEAYAKAGDLVDAELLESGSADRLGAKPSGHAKPVSNWRQRVFLEAMIARASRMTTAFDRFVLDGSRHTPLENELALHELLAGDFVGASQLLGSGGAASSGGLGTDPFVVHIVDCHDCDHEKYAQAPWTSASVAARLVELEKVANGSGERAAEASLALGNALYNLSYFGNARVMFDNSHQLSSDTRAAERWLKRAYDLSKNRELKVKAAFLAAKCERGRLEDVDVEDPWANVTGTLPIPKTWYPVVKRYADTKYYREILNECGSFARWVAH